MKVSIHQPTYLPWLGFFHKLALSDVHVILDDCMLSRQSWINRVNIRVGNVACMLSVPVYYRFRDSTPIRDIRIDATKPWIRKHRQTIVQNYKKCPYFEAVETVLEAVFSKPFEYLIDLDIAGIEAIKGLLGITPRIYRSSDLGMADLTGTERLVALTKAVGGTTYISGTGSDGYLDPACFDRSKIGLRRQVLEYLPYEQSGGGVFLASLSSIDALANIGSNGVMKWLETNRT